MGSWWFLLLGTDYTELVGFFSTQEVCEQYRTKIEESEIAAKSLLGNPTRFRCMPCVSEEEDE